MTASPAARRRGKRSNAGELTFGEVAGLMRRGYVRPLEPAAVTASDGPGSGPARATRRRAT
ncbi:MAG: hypothetical protein ACRDOK_01535 [Streptosporangiaceae bacterium]